MNKMSVTEILTTICVSYTIISIVAALINLMTGSQADNLNTIAMLLFTSIAVFVLSLHNMFDNLSPLLMIIIQYVVALGLVMISVFLIGLISPVSEGGYKDIFISFTIPYIIGAFVYYVSVFHQAKCQNDLLQEIKRKKE